MRLVKVAKTLLATTLLALTASCAGPDDPIERYLDEARDAAAASGTQVPEGREADAGLLFAGVLTCGFAEAPAFAPAAQQLAEQQALAEIALKYCDTAFAEPFTPEQREKYGLEELRESFLDSVPPPPSSAGDPGEPALQACMEQTGMTRDGCIAEAASGGAS